MSDFVTDTHALIWYLEDSDDLGADANAAFDACDRGESFIYIPTICLVELIYLQEKGRIPLELKKKLDNHLRSGKTNFLIVDLSIEVVNSLEGIARETVPDLPDRIIASTAKAMGLPLLSRDRALQKSGLTIIW